MCMLMASLRNLAEHFGRTADRVPRESPSSVPEGTQCLFVRFLVAAELSLESSLQLRKGIEAMDRKKFSPDDGLGINTEYVINPPASPDY